LGSKKQLCKQPSDAKWICSSWSECSNKGNGWTQTRSCLPDDSAKCRVFGHGPDTQICKPNASQQQLFETKQKSIKDKIKYKEEQAEQQANQQTQAAQLIKLKSSVLEIYNLMLSTQKTSDQIVSMFSGTTSMQLFQLASQYSEKVLQMKIYVNKVSLGTLQLSDSPTIVSINDTANDIATRLLTIAKAARSVPQTTPYQQIYVVPVSPSQPTLSHQEVCNQITIKAALSGGFGSSDVANQLYSAGCITLEKYCIGFALSGGSLPAECK
jgi:hypothetical protein